MPNFCDASIDTYKSFEHENHEFDLLFIGRYDKEREAFIDFLKNSFSHLKFGFFGLTKETVLMGNRYLKTIGTSKIGINYSRKNDISMYSSDRIIHLLANGVLVFSPRIPNLETIIAEDEIVYFDDNEDFTHKLNYYLEHDEERVKIAKKGWIKAHQSFNEIIMTKNMIQTIYINKEVKK